MPLIIIGVVLVIALTGVKIIPQSKAYVVERLGAYDRTMQTGLHYVIPFIERVSNVVNLKEIVKDFAPQPVITEDNVTMQIDTVVYFHITDPKLYTYGIENPVSAIENLTATTLRNIIGDLELDETLTSRDVINTQMRSILDVATDPWGIRVSRVEVKNILPPRDIQEAMEKQMRAERERRESILKAEGEKKSAILIAEGEKESAILRADAKRESQIREAEGQAAAILKIQEATAQGLKLLKDVGMDEPLLKYKSYEAMVEVANGQSTKIIVPSELQNLTTAGVTFHETAPANNVPKKKHAEAAPAAPVAPAATPVNNKQFLETLSK